jgi:cytochrome subunit of sulfide dehydrogenase
MAARRSLPAAAGRRLAQRAARAVAAAALAGATVAVHAQPEALALRSLAANCAQCHGTDGRALAGSPLPSLAGQPREQLLAKLLAFKAGTQPSTIMQQLARGYSDAQLERLAAWFAAQPAP